MTFNADRLAARWVLGFARGRELAQAATDALAHGHDDDALRTLAGEVDHDLADISGVVERCFVEWNTRMPDPKSAALLLAREYAEGMLSGSLKAYDGARLIWLQLSNIVRPDDHVLDPFVYWASEYEEAPDPQRKAFCETAILTSARELLEAGAGRPTIG